MLNDLDKILEQVLAALVGDDGGGEVTENPRAGGLNGVDIRWLEKQVDDGITTLGVVEEDKQGPVEEPGTLLQLVERRGKVLLNIIRKVVQFLFCS